MLVAYVTMELPAHRPATKLAALTVLQLLVQIEPAPLVTRIPQVTLVVCVQTSIVLEVVLDQTSVML